MERRAFLQVMSAAIAGWLAPAVVDAHVEKGVRLGFINSFTLYRARVPGGREPFLVIPKEMADLILSSRSPELQLVKQKPRDQRRQQWTTARWWH